MLQANIDKLEKYRYVLVNRSFTPMEGHNLQDVLDVIREEFDPNHRVDMFCSYCLMKMVEYAFSEMEKRMKADGGATDRINIQL
mgnify:CR=1 FL=1